MIVLTAQWWGVCFRRRRWWIQTPAVPYQRQKNGTNKLPCLGAVLNCSLVTGPGDGFHQEGGVEKD